VSDYYDVTGTPTTGASLSSSAIRSEFSAIAAAFAKLPTLTGNGSKFLRSNSGGTSIESLSAADTRSALGLVIGTNVQAWDADLDAIAALAKTDSNFIVGNGSTWVAESGATVRTSLGLTIGTDVQAYDAELAAIAGLTSAADRLPYFTGSGSASLATFTAGGRALVNSAGTANTFPYFSSSNTVTLGSITSAGRALLDDTDSAAMLVTLGITSGSYTGTLTGCTTSPTITINYSIIGDVVIISTDDNVTGTSNSTSFTITGAPTAIRPVTNDSALAPAVVTNNGSENNGGVFVFMSTSGTLTFMHSGTLTGFTSFGTKGISAGYAMSYVYKINNP